jgi:hypothetical protein
LERHLLASTLARTAEGGCPHVNHLEVIFGDYCLLSTMALA